MSISKVRIGILGAGSMGTEHAFSCGPIEGVEIAGVFSRTTERAAVAAKTCNARAVTDPRALIEDPAIDAIDVCLPSVNHAEFVTAALAAGKHVFCETPFALRIEDAVAMIEAARNSKRVLMVGLLMRCIAHYEHVHRAVNSGEHGKLLSMMAYRLGSYLRVGGQDHKDHYSDPSTELMTFDFDFANWLMGTPVRVSATAVRTAAGTPGEISAVVDFEGGCTATVLASGILPRSFPFSAGFRVLFEKGAFDLSNVFKDGPPESKFTFFPDEGIPQEVSIAGHNPYEAELRLFVDCIRGKGDPSLLGAEHALNALALSLATQRSLEEHTAIDVASMRTSLGI
jgi:UDP-N-acetylglucosamine 3-dehydrogenase